SVETDRLPWTITSLTTTADGAIVAVAGMVIVWEDSPSWVTSKLRSFNTIEPVRPLSELTPAPNVRLPSEPSVTPITAAPAAWAGGAANRATPAALNDRQPA